MATFPSSPVNYGALKVSFPANLPRNEKDLICMLLAGRLKDLWNGKLVCAQLAIDDLIKDLTGVSALQSLRDGLTKLKGSMDDFKRASGYDKILGGVNQALGQVGNVFSLGGLCPSPVTPPKIPDVLATLNQNLFGQANGILNALAQASNPKVCLGGGPKGFSLDWSKVTGDLKLLKNAIGEFKKNPAGFNNVMKAFESNISNQAKRLNSELKRLEQNLTDPLGINEKRNTASNVKRSKTISDGFPVKDKNGVEYKNPTRSMIPGEIEYVLNRTDPRYVTPISYVTKPVFDYCGELTGYVREVITGDPEYAGYDTYFTNLNIPTPTVNPEPTYAEYDFLFKEENGQIKLYDTDANILTNLNLERGKHYRIGMQLLTTTLVIGSGGTPWKPGITVTKEPDYGVGFETTQVEGAFNSSTVEIDWAVKIENPTTPNLLTWSASNGQGGNINISGITALPEVDKTYDTSMATKKAWLNVVHVNENVPTGGTIRHETRYRKRKYKVITKIVDDTGKIIEIKDSDPESRINYGQGLKVIKDKENFLLSDPIEGGKILLMSQLIPIRYYPPGTPRRYFVIKKFINDDAGMQVNQISCYITDGTPANIENPLFIQPLTSLQFDNPVILLNDARLPHTDYNNYKLSLGSNGKLNDNEENKSEIINYNGKKYLGFNLSSNRKMPSTNDLPVNSFVVSSYIELDPNDQVRDFTTVDPIEKQSYHCFKGMNGFLVECEITYLEDIPAENSINTQVKSSPTGSYLPPDSFTVPQYTFRQNTYQTPFRPVIINGARPPYVYSIDPPLPPGLIFDVDTGTIRGTPTEQQDRVKHTVSIDEEDVNLYKKQFYISISPP